MLSRLYQAVRQGELIKKDADRRLDARLARAVRDLVVIAPIEALS